MSTVNEEDCIAIYRNGCTVYMYPFDAEVASTGAKVTTRTGKTVKHLLIEKKGGVEVVTGELGGERLTWSAYGRFNGQYVEHENDLYIPERYFDPGWKEKRHLTNAVWASRYQREHPFCKAPDRYARFEQYRASSPFDENVLSNKD